ncbi:MAG: hypothetical protein A2284_02775 [Deltaproteobacteria bacterium RIFOXYA12_FULL_61_11]|nr:MAG: hypothetical protein A2284_02775 [Deltaproteobacteria bacterium RIFOXYA12_FULL_61_11]
MCKLTCVLVLFFAVSTATAYQTPSSFEQPTSGTVNFYTGSPRSQGLGCNNRDSGQCHPKPAADVEAFTLTPTSNMRQAKDQSNLQYKPLEQWTFEVKINTHEYSEKGLSATASTAQNGLNAEVLDSTGKSVGTLYYGDNTLLNVSAGSFEEGTVILDEDTNTRIPRWSFTWQAPNQSAGTVDLYLSAVDGDGDGTPRGDITRAVKFSIYPEGSAPAGDIAATDPAGSGTTTGTTTGGTTTDGTTGGDPSNSTAGTTPPATYPNSQPAYNPNAGFLPPTQKKSGSTGGCGCVIQAPSRPCPVEQLLFFLPLPLAFYLTRARLRRR